MLYSSWLIHDFVLYYSKIYCGIKFIVVNYEDFVFRFDLFRTASLKQFNNDIEYVDGIITNTIYSGDINTRLITNADNTLNIKINEKYLDLFDNPEIKIKAEDKPVLVYENGIFVGLILPIKEKYYERDL